MTSKHGPTRIARLLRDPLTVFGLIGIAIFALDAVVSARQADAQAITVSAAHVDALRSDYIQRHGQAPTDTELRQLAMTWVEREALVRHARALGLDEQDRLIRRQLIRKMRYLIEDTHPLDEPTLDDLRAWLDNNPQRYRQPPTISFDHVFVSRGPDADRRLAIARDALAGSAEMPQDTVFDPFPGPDRLEQITPLDVSARFGDGFWTQLEAAPTDTWHGPLDSRLGWHWVRVIDTTPARPGTLDTAGQQLRTDYLAHQREQMNQRAVADIVGEYAVRLDGVDAR